MRLESLTKNTHISSLTWHYLYKIMFILPVMKDHLSWESTKLSGCFVQVSLYNFKLIIQNTILGTCCKIVFICVPQNLSEVSSSSGNGSVSPGSKPLPEPMLTQICVTIWHHSATIGYITYRQISNISRTSVGNKFVDTSDVVRASPVGTAPTTSSFST